MDLLVAYQDDPAGYNMAKYLSKDMNLQDGIFCGNFYDLAVIPTPAISADWLEDEYDYDGFVFLSKHAAESGTLALTCHSTGNFTTAKFGGNNSQIAVPYPHLQKAYLQALKQRESMFPDFQITIEATHHGPTALKKPSIFIEIGTTDKQWSDASLCSKVAHIVDDVMRQPIHQNPVAICFGGTHYPTKFTNELLNGRHALGTVIPRHALEYIDEDMLDHILKQNHTASSALLDWSGLGSHKQRIINLLDSTNLDVIKL